MTRQNRSRLKRIEDRAGLNERGLVVIRALADNPDDEEAAKAEARASGLAREGDGFIVVRCFSSEAEREAFRPYRIDDVGAMLKDIAEHGRRIYDR